jgi:hypothetical protein
LRRSQRPSGPTANIIIIFDVTAVAPAPLRSIGNFGVAGDFVVNPQDALHGILP